MRRQRNNLASLKYEHRQLCSKLLFEGRPYAEIREALTGSGCGVKLHNSTFSAWQKSAEYKEYCEVRKGFDDRSRANRLAALVQNDGRGPQSLADIAEYEVLQNVLTLAPAAETPQQVQALANAIASLKRGQAAAVKDARNTEIEQLKAAHEAETIALETENARLQAEIQALRNPQEDLSSLSDEDKAKRIRQRIGME